MRIKLRIITIFLSIIKAQETAEDPEPSISGELGSRDEIEDAEMTQTIRTGSGPVKGRRVTDEHGKVHYEFLGIPFAEPPTGSLRFLPPVPVNPWHQTLSATQDGPPCLQPITGFDIADLSSMSEDCLTLNVFSTNIADSGRPVMLWIYGGGFNSGSKDIYRMRGLIDEDVILVTINYRLHALGFLSFGNDVVSGNMGLRDQHLALQWVRYNIREFGGDPDRITIFGESAGAMSVQAQVLSPLNSGLLAGAIAQSGSILWTGLDEGSEGEIAGHVLEALGCPQSLDSRSLECLQRLDMASLMVNITDDPEAFMDSDLENKFQFMPVIDSYASNPFLPLDPLEALKTGQYNKVPYISGTVKNEGVLFTAPLRLAGMTGSEILEAALEMDDSMLFLRGDEKLKRIASRFYNHSTGDSDIELEQPAIDLVSDIWFGSMDQKSVELMSGHSRNVYNYYLTQQTNNSWLGSMMNISVEYTPIHGDDVMFMISNNTLEDTVNMSVEERRTAEHIIKYWTNFAKFGNPSPLGMNDVPTWYPVTPHKMHYMELKAEPVMSERLLEDRMEFWERMTWQERERRMETKLLYSKTVNFLTESGIEVVGV